MDKTKTVVLRPSAGVVGQLEKCMFSDECDFCAIPSMGTYAKMSRVPMENTEAEFYVCGRCATMRDWLPNLKDHGPPQ